jgi:hypothetical protein
MSIELDNPDTWPSDIRNEIAALAMSRAASEAEDVRKRVNRLLGGHAVVGYHCTRLSDREVLEVKTDGLKVLTGSLIEAKVASAVATGDVDAELGDTILRHQWGDDQKREGQIAFFGVRSPFRSLHLRHAYHYLLGEWGGEAVAYPLERTEH